MAMVKRIGFHVLAPLLAGVVTYIAWRQTEVRLVGWSPRWLASFLRATLGRIALPSAVVGSIPDAAWAWAFGASLALVWQDRPWRDKAPWLAIGGALAISVELAQAA